MESPVRSVDAATGSRKSSSKEEASSAASRFEAKSYLQRQVEVLSCADEEEAQEKVSKRLELKQERAKKKRDIQLQRRRKGISERLRKIREARQAANARLAENAALLMERQVEKQTSATRRRRISLENIKKARALHNRRVNQRRRESFDATGEFSPARSKGMDEIESKLARAERNRENLRCERRRRTMECYKEGRTRALQQGLLGLGAGSGGAMGSVWGVAGVDTAREHRRRCAMEARQEAKARQKQRMRDLREHMLSHASRVSERKTRAYAARLLQAWWRCVRAGKRFNVADLTIMAVEEPMNRASSSSSLGSPSSWAAAQGISVSVGDIGAAAAGGQQAMRAPKSPLDPCTKSPLPTFRKFSAGVGGKSLCVREAGEAGEAGASRDAASPAQGAAGFGSSYKAAVAIQSFLRRNMHTLKVANALMAGRLSINVLCATVNTMSSSTFDEAIDVMSKRVIIGHCETTLKALRMGREMRCVPHTVRSARAFLSALLVNFFPTSALDDGGALSSPANGTAPLKVEKDRLVRAAGKVISALLDLEATVDAAAEAGGTQGTHITALDPEHFRRIRRVSGNMVRARVAFCRRFAEWKRKDAARLADEMTAASVDVILMQLRAERDLRRMAVKLRLEDADDGGALFSTGYEQMKHGTQRQLTKMLQALSKLVGSEEARRRMREASEAAQERMHGEELMDDVFLRRITEKHARELGIPMETDESDAGGPGQRSPRVNGNPSEAGSMGASSGTAVYSWSGGAGASEAATAPPSARSSNEEEDEIAGPRRPLTAGDLLRNEWLVHEVMISEDPLMVTLEEAIENQLLRSGNPAAAGGSEAAADEFWSNIERNVAAEDYSPLLGLVAELRDKIIGLTPRRRDLAAETCEAMDVELLQQMMTHGAFDVGCFFRMVAFAGERVLELEAPIRNEGTKTTLAGWRRTQEEVESGRRRLEPAMVRECFEYLFSKTDEIHVDILNAHLQFVTPFLKQHGVEYERDRFTEKLDAGETSLDMTHLWLHRAILSLRKAAADAEAVSANPPPTAPVTGARHGTAQPPVKSSDGQFYRQLLCDLEQRRGDAYLKLLRVAMVDNLLGAIVKVERKSNFPDTTPSEASAGGKTGVVASGTRGTGSTALAATIEAAVKDDRQEDLLENTVAIPETLHLDQYRLVVVAAGAEQVSYTASLVAFSRQALAGGRVPLTRADEDRVRDALMVLFDTEDVTTADICAQVTEMTRQIAVAANKPLSASQVSMLAARARNVLTTGDCPVYKLFLRRTLGVIRETLVEGGMPEERFVEVVRKVGLVDYKSFLLERVVRLLMIIERHNEAVFATFYNEIIPLALQTTDPATTGVSLSALISD